MGNETIGLQTMERIGAFILRTMKVYWRISKQETNIIDLSLQRITTAWCGKSSFRAQALLDPRLKPPVFHTSGLATHSSRPNEEPSNGGDQRKEI
jgi:hypothetical protein